MKQTLRPGHWLYLLCLWVLIFAAYSNTLQAPPVFDGAKILTQDTRIREATGQNLRLIFGEEYWYGSAPSGLYRPLTTLSFLFNYAVLGNEAQPAGYHWINVALHLLNVTLLYALGLAIFADPLLALALAALWGLHPLLTDAVTNIAGRADLLAALGVLAGLLCYIRSSGARRWLWIAGLALAQLAGLLSKENAAVLPGLMLLYDLSRRDRLAWRERVPAYAALLLPFAVFFYLRSGVQTHMVIPFSENPMVSAGFWTARLTALKVAARLLGLFAWPARLSPDYSYNAVPLFAWSVADAIALLTLLGGAVLAWRWRKTVWFFVGFYIVAAAPTANVVFLIGSIMAERFMYLPAIGLAGCVVAAIPSFARARDRLKSVLLLGVVCTALEARTYVRNIDWGSEIGFWQSAVDVCPDAARPHNNLGNALMKTGQVDRAIPEFQTALRILPQYTDAHYNLGNALAQIEGRVPEAIAEFQEALRIEPRFAAAHINLGTALAHIPGRIDEAIAEYRAAVALDPNSLDAHYNLGTLLPLNPEHVPQAIEEFQTVLRLDPGYFRAHNNLGSLYLQMGRVADAIAEFRIALKLNPDYAKARENLDNALRANAK